MLGNRELWAVSVASGIRSIGFGATWPFMALFFNEQLNIPVYVVGIIFTLGSLVSLVFSLLGGGLSDYIGRKKVLLIGSAISSALYLLMAIFLNAGAGALLIAALFVMTPIGGSLIFPSANALVADVTEEKDRTNGYVIYRIMANLGWAIGPFSGALLDVHGIFWIFILVTVCSAIQGVIVLLVVKDRWMERKRREKLDSPGRISFLSYDRFLLVFSMGTFFVTLVSSQFSVTMPVYAGIKVGLPHYELGYIYAVNGVVVVLGQYPTTNFMKRFPEIASMIAGAVAYSIGYLLVGFSTTLLDLMLVMVVITVGENLVSPVMNSIVSKIAPRDKLARYLGFLGMVNSSGRALGPSVGAFFLSIFAFNGLLVWSSIDLFGAASIMAFLAFIRISGKTDAGTARPSEGL